GQAGGIDRVVLDLLGQRACERRTLYRQYLADLVDGDLDLPVGHLLGDVAARLQARLWLDLFGNAELLQQPRDFDAAGAAGGRIDIGDGLGRKQRALEGVDRAQIRLRRALLHGNANPDFSDCAAA